jgi:hypothetical protein
MQPDPVKIKYCGCNDEICSPDDCLFCSPTGYEDCPVCSPFECLTKCKSCEECDGSGECVNICDTQNCEECVEFEENGQTISRCESKCGQDECCNGSGECRPCGCEGDGDCPEGKCCEDGECVPCPCPEDEDCGEGACCVDGSGRKACNNHPERTDCPGSNGHYCTDCDVSDDEAEGTETGVLFGPYATKEEADAARPPGTIGVQPTSSRDCGDGWYFEVCYKKP